MSNAKGKMSTFLVQAFLARMIEPEEAVMLLSAVVLLAGAQPAPGISLEGIELAKQWLDYFANVDAAKDSGGMFIRSGT